ncbi:MAG: PD40 domain-containing protein [Phycisphaerae bacterium]|nr:PD40 domain-containing protein [Phycisphaerae bacterium]
MRDPVVHYDGKTILFSWRKGDSEHYHLWRIDADGTGLRQLTDGAYDDFEPCWLPDTTTSSSTSPARRSRCCCWVL